MPEHEDKPAIYNDLSHPCYGCLNTLPKDSKEIIDNSTLCLEGKEPEPGCLLKITISSPQSN
jgi:hypothetical protein